MKLFVRITIACVLGMGAVCATNDAAASNPIPYDLKFYSVCSPTWTIEQEYDEDDFYYDGSCGTNCWKYQIFECVEGGYTPNSSACGVRGVVEWSEDADYWYGNYSYDGDDWEIDGNESDWGTGPYYYRVMKGGLSFSYDDRAGQINRTYRIVLEKNSTEYEIRVRFERVICK